MKSIKYILVAGVALFIILLPASSWLPWKHFDVFFAVYARAADKKVPVPAVRAPELKPDGGAEEIPDWLARWELARALSYMQRYDEALTEYRKLIREKPDLVEARVEIANIFHWQGKAEESLRELEKTPFHALPETSRLLMADIYRTRKQYDRSVSLYSEHLSKKPDDLGVRFRLAEVLSWMKDYPASLGEYEKILKAKPSDVQVRRKYAFVLIWAGRQADAARELRMTLK